MVMTKVITWDQVGLYLSDINNGIIICYWLGSIPPITLTKCITIFDDYSSCHGGGYTTIPNGYYNGGAIAVGY